MCDQASGSKKYCPDCARLINRKRTGLKPNKDRRRERLDAQWCEDRKAFICEYTGIALTRNGGARNAEWEHVIPRDESSVVLVAAVVNRMKADLDDEQWDAMIASLYALRIEGKPFEESALPVRWQTQDSSWREDE